jgi:acyl-CoA thioesterase FadM
MVLSRIVRRIESRGYELDAGMVVSASTLLRYFEHMRWEAIRDPAGGLGSVFDNGFRMVVRAQQLEIDSTVGMAVDLELSLEMGRVGRASMDMLHEVRSTSDGKRVARGVVTAVYLNPSGQPHPIPDSMRSFAPVKEHPLLVANPSEPPSEVWIRQCTVVPSDQDLFQHMNHARYLDYFNDTRLMACQQHAYGQRSTKAAKPLVRANLDYRRQAVAGDTLSIVTWSLSEEAMGFEMRKSPEGEVLCRCRLEVQP